MLKEAILNSQLPGDNEILLRLQQARNSGKQLATIVGDLVEGAIQNGNVGAEIIKRYPKTISYLSQEQNLDWIINDLGRTLNYLKTMSNWLNRQ